MKSLYESILDVDTSQDVPRLKDAYTVSNITMGNGNWSKVVITNFFDWRKLQSSCKKCEYFINSKWKNADGVGIGELVALIENVYLIGFEQNIVGELRRFVKPDINVVLDESAKLNNHNVRLNYILKSTKHNFPEYELEIGVYLHKIPDSEKRV